MIRVRTIPEAVRELKAEDPRTPITEWAIRQLVKQGKLPRIQIGNKALINMDILEQFLSDNCVTAPPMRKEVIGWPQR